jgi:hypothetical protein
VAVTRRVGGAVGTIVSVVLAVAGCAHTHQWLYDKPGMTPESFDRDRAACRNEAPARGLTKTLGSDDVDRSAYSACMERRGYTVRRESL